MFQFGKKVFGKKISAPSVAPSSVAPPPETPSRLPTSSLSELSLDAILQRCVSMATREGKYSPDYYIQTTVADLSPDERMALFVSILPEMDQASGYIMSGSKGRATSLEYCHRACMEFEMLAGKEHLPALIRSLTTLDRYKKEYYNEPCARMIRLMRAAIKDGGYFTSADCETLAAYATTLRTIADKQYRKAAKKALISRAETVEKLAGVEVSATSTLLERCDGAENPYAMGDKPADYDFWCALLAATISGLHDIVADLKGKRPPAWMTDASAFSAHFPAVGPIAPRFGAWTEGDDASWHNFNALKTLGKLKKGLASAEEVLALPARRSAVEPLFRYIWTKKEIPALDVLADLENPAWTAFVEHLLTSRNSPRPTRSWVKDGLALANSIGIDDVEKHLHAWLDLFHSPVATPEVLTNATNCHVMDRTALHLSETLPDWPSLIGADQMAVAGRAFAMHLASESSQRIAQPLSIQLLRHTDYAYKGRSVTKGLLSIEMVSLKNSGGGTYYGSLQSWLKLSLENEQILRGALWMVAQMPDRAAAISALEKSTMAAASQLNFGEEGLRSKIIANAAIATLIDMGGSDVDPVLLRLSRQIENRTINAALFKALNAA